MKVVKVVVFGLLLSLVAGMVVLMNGEGGDTAVSAQSTFSQRGFPGLAPTLIADGFTQPVDITTAGDARLFIVEQIGVIRIIDTDGAVLQTPFLDMSEQIEAGGEQGLLALAFDPNFEDTGYFYVSYTHCSEPNTCPFTSQQTPNLSTRISRFEISSDPYVADPDSELIILEVDQPFGNHNGGDIAFGPDGFLYIGLGDGGSFNDPRDYSQNLETMLGKMLRISLNPTIGTQPDCDEDGLYTIPNLSGHFGNPFIDGPGGNCDEIWSYGLRNPWRFSFDRDTGALFIGDVGQYDWEEVNYQLLNSEGGENWGWRCYEGNHEKDITDCDDLSQYDFPILEYPHDDDGEFVGCSVTGGYIYRGAEHPLLNGYYLYADFCSGRFWMALKEVNGEWNPIDIGPLSGISSVSTFGEDCYGELFVADYADGEIYKILPSTGMRFVGGSHESFLPIVLDANGSSASTPTAVASPTSVIPDQCN